ncbi:hypothetical protein ACFX13_033704 [Malus domestica]
MLACSLQASCVHPYLHLTVRLLEPIKQRVSPSSSAAANLGIAESDNAINPHTSPSPATSTASKQLRRRRHHLFSIPPQILTNISDLDATATKA